MLRRRIRLKLIATLAAMPAAEAQTPPRVSKEMVVAALATMGLSFTDPQLDMGKPAGRRPSALRAC